MTTTTRWRLDVAYDGTAFSGWAAQPGLRTVQGTLEAALAMMLRLPRVQLTVAGRTDAGVHARGQVCHLDLPADVLVDEALETSPARSRAPSAGRLIRRLGRVLPDDVRVHSIMPAPVGFDARFSAVWRRYAYRICDDPAAADPLVRRWVQPWPRRLDEAAMHEAAQRLVGEHDFAAFCRAREGATTIRALHELAWTREGSWLTGRVVADAFCHTMVRSLVGCLVAVGEGRRPVGWPAEVLAARERDPAVRVMRPGGLTLEEVGYPPDDELADRAVLARNVRRLVTPTAAQAGRDAQ